MYYIQESDKPSKILKMLNCIKLQDNTIILPTNQEPFQVKQAEKLAIKTKKILRAVNANKVVISKKLKSEETYINFLYSEGVDVVNGKWLFSILSTYVLDYIIDKKQMMKSDICISIVVNQITENMIYMLRKIVKEYKRINIVTNHIPLFKNLEKQILDEYGIMITVTNNKKKSLSKSHMIVNFDFPNELINQYNINDDAIVINLQGNVKISRKRFNGITINDYEIRVLNGEDFDYEKCDSYFCKDLYEAQLYRKQPIEDVLKKIKKDGVQIEKLFGVNTIIQ